MLPWIRDGLFWDTLVGTLRLIVRTGTEAERFNTAFYRYLELHARTAEEALDGCMLQTTPGRDSELKVVTLWSDEAAADFLRFWSGYRVAGAPERRMPLTARS